MAFENLQIALTGAFNDLLVGVVEFLPKLIVAIVIVILGWLLGAALSKIISQLFKALKVDAALEASGAGQIVRRSGSNLNSGHFVGELVKWFIVVVSAVAVLGILGLDRVTFFLEEAVLGYLPQVIVAVLILVIGIALSEVVRKVIIASSKAAGFRKASLLGAVAKYAIWTFAILAALFQLEIAATFIQTLFTGIVVALSLGLGLAFGLGGRDAARDVIEGVRNEIKDRN